MNNSNEGRLYIKVTLETYEKMKEFEGMWAENVEIMFIINEE